jgi:hypothetical protein
MVSVNLTLGLTMSAYQDQIRETFRTLESEELVSRIKGGALTKEAHSAALTELNARGVATNELPPAPSSSEAEPEPGFLKRCFSGKEQLWKAYWLLGSIGTLLWLALRFFTSSGTTGGALLFLLLVILLFHIFWSVSVWRCAFHTSHWAWAVAARGHVLFLAAYIVASLWPVVMLWAGGRSAA